jgi:hypothetical protein
LPRAWLYFALTEKEEDSYYKRLLERRFKKVKTERMQIRLWIPYEMSLRETDLESECEIKEWK